MPFKLAESDVASCLGPVLEPVLGLWEVLHRKVSRIGKTVWKLERNFYWIIDRRRDGRKPIMSNNVSEFIEERAPISMYRLVSGFSLNNFLATVIHHF